MLASTSTLIRPVSLTINRSLASTVRRYASTHPVTVTPSHAELSSGRLADRNLEIAARSLHEDGLVVVTDVIPQADLDHLNARMVADAQTLQRRGKDMPFNYNVGNSKRSHYHPVVLH